MTRATPTTIGYRLGSVTPIVRPSVAITNENSPICDRPVPTRTAVRKSCPATTVPNVLPAICPIITTSEMPTMGTMCCHNSPGSTNRPIATKNTAVNRSRTGSTSDSMRRLCFDSAITAPTRNAPSATLKPSLAATSDVPKHSPSTATNRRSLLSKRATKFSRRGTTRSPATSTVTRNTSSLPAETAIEGKPRSPVDAMPVSSTIITTPSRSSTIRMP